jgi:hydrogenase maturation factor
MWCVAPEWPEHARHVAVEFVHPVIMGKRALPAVAVTDGDLVSALRAITRPGDILCAVSSDASSSVRAAMRRVRVWGLTTVWIGAGHERPEPGLADHVLWVDTATDSAACDGSIVLRYHLLWELTHVCFEHPGLLAAAEDACAPEAACLTCSDEGRVVEVLTVDSMGVAVVRSERGIETIDVNLVMPIEAGDLVLVHAGAAIALVEGATW